MHYIYEMAPKRSPGLSQLKPTNLRQQARAAIRARIVTGDVEAGVIYPVAHFASQLGVSSTPVREALFDLVHEGLVELVRNRGFRVVDLSEHDLDEIFELRLLLEVLAVRQLTGKLSAEDVAECERLASEIEVRAAAGDLEGFLVADRDFHLRLLAALENQRLAKMVARLRNEARLFGLPSLSASGALMSSAEEHRRILDSVRRGDSADAEARMRRHIEHTRGIWAGQTEGRPAD
jgi:DNA-binding GntR family transcriptional regulator